MYQRSLGSSLGATVEIHRKDRRRTRRLPVRPKMGPLRKGDIWAYLGKGALPRRDNRGTMVIWESTRLPSLYVASLLLARCASRGHITLLLLALAYLTGICATERFPPSPPAPSPLLARPALLALTVPEVRHLLAQLIWPSSSSACRVLA
jgi:hypothetical protein